jgi:hypothetical protein
MPQFFFEILERDGSITNSQGDFGSLEDAKAEARRTLADVGADGLPLPPLNMVSVQILDGTNQPVWEARLVLDEIDKAAMISAGAPDGE